MQEKESIIVVRCDLKILSPGPLKILIVVYACKNVHVLYFIMQMLENLPDIIGLIIRTSIMPAWPCACVSVISQCLLKLYHRLIG